MTEKKSNRSYNFYNLSRLAVNHRNQTLPQVLSLMAEQELQDLPESVKACSMVYLPDIGYLLAITRLEGTPSEDWELPGLEFKFVANNIGHYKSPGAIGTTLVVLVS